MKKVLFVMSVALIAFFANSCSEDLTNDVQQAQKENPSADGYKPQYEYAYALKRDKDTYGKQTKAQNQNGALWEQDYTIKIKFLNGTDVIRNKVKEIAQEWEQYINLEFEYVPDSTSDRNADVRISFNEPGTSYQYDRMSWAYYGVFAQDYSRGNTAHIAMETYGDNDELNSMDFHAQVLRVFGFILGLVPEHLGNDSKIIVKEMEAMEYFLGFGWDEYDIEDYIIYPLRARTAGIYDSKSIMQIPLPDHIFDYDGPASERPNLHIVNWTLSDNDIAYIKYLYPNTGADPWVKGEEGLVYMTLPSTGNYGDVGIEEWDWDTNTTVSGIQSRTYRIREVGEYTWTAENLHLKYRDLWATLYKRFNITQAEVDFQLAKWGNPANTANVDQFIHGFGTWITEYAAGASGYRHPGKIGFYDYKGGPKQEGWDLPDTYDILQLLGQMPVKYGRMENNIRDFLFASSKVDNIRDYNIPYLQSGGSTSGLAIMPLGFSTNQHEPWTGRQLYSFGSGFGLKIRTAPDFQAGKQMFVFNEEGIIVGTPGNDGNGFYHFCSARYCKKKTDEELGYKMYYSELTDQVIFVDSCNEPPVIGRYVELPKGLERGIALRYSNRNLKVVKQSWSNIKNEAARMLETIQVRYYPED